MYWNHKYLHFLPITHTYEYKITHTSHKNLNSYFVPKDYFYMFAFKTCDMHYKFK